ncbi:ABC transporter ATP-binding protein [Reyranella aquatilis]|uniref:ABC transporter ATP-binding protein n=1 Tax=Reyranella aquatilis TaxID=2035356 RepID=A0ABS8KR80_9HYPH|nr:ABC transporter ATP-binding protein [Reyranella aquatilis]MCC8428560.1 ABC transporter ATP-binding protein [Reyranella aquatilis]
MSVREARVGFFTARGPLRAVDGVSFDLEKGQTLGIVGESGSGKSVLVRSLIGLVGESSGAEVGGQVLFEGRDLRALPAREFRGVLGRDIGVVFQDPMTSLNPVMKIGHQIGEGLRLNRGLDARAAAARAVELLTEVGIPEAERRAGQYPHELSGGMRQRVAIAIAIACAPKLLIADEPTTALDVTVQRQILDLLQREQRERGMAMILITHDLGVAAGRADDIMVMYAGRAVETAKTRELFRSPRMPYTEALLRSLPRLTDPTHTRLSAIPGRPPDLARRSGGCAFAPRCRYRTDRCDEEQPMQTWEGARGYACFHPRGVDVGGSGGAAE